MSEARQRKGLTCPEVQNHLNHFLATHDRLLSILCHEHGDFADSISTCTHVSVGWLSLLAKLSQVS